MLKLVTAVWLLTAAGGVFADGVPDPVVTYTESLSGFAVIAGKLALDVTSVYGIKVKNGGLTYSTLTDNTGRWSVVIRHRAVNYSVESFDLSSPSLKSLEKAGEIVKN